MLDLYEDVRSDPNINKLEADNLLFAEYTCPIEEPSRGIWAHTDYLVHVISGKKIWHTTRGSWTAEAGQTLFFKKGAAIVEQRFEEDFCLLLFFIPDDFVRRVLKEYSAELTGSSQRVTTGREAIRVNNDAALSVYFKSMHALFSEAEKPSGTLLGLKLKELILAVMLSRNNSELSSYFRSLAENPSPRLPEIMEANFRYNLTLEEFAKICHRSLSSFKRDFHLHFKESPGKWLLNKRLEYAAVLLRSRDMNISQIVFESGFEDLSHFSRAFKTRFGIPPSKFRTHDPVTS